MLGQQAQSTSTAEQVYKNIRVLKGIPSDQLIPAMQFISASLGVECSFCHVENHFDRDDKKPKQTARKMMQMMMAINRNNFDSHQEVTCNSCHRGSRMPAAIPAISEGRPKLHPSVQNADEMPPNLPTVDQLIAKYVGATGGAAAIQKLTSLEEKGTADFAGRQAGVEVLDQSPDKRVFTIELPMGSSVVATDGTEGWLAAPHRPLHVMSAGELEATRLDADLQLPLHLTQLFDALRQLPPEKIHEHDCYVLIGEKSHQPRAQFYFDQQSGLLLRMIQFAPTPLGSNPTRIDYSDFRTVNGIQVPYRWTVAKPAGQYTVQIEQVIPNATIAPEKFNPPPGTAEATK